MLTVRPFAADVPARERLRAVTGEYRRLGVAVIALRLATQSVDRTLRFQIDAVLYVESLRERVRFNSTLDTASGKISVKPNDRT